MKITDAKMTQSESLMKAHQVYGREKDSGRLENRWKNESTFLHSSAAETQHSECCQQCPQSCHLHVSAITLNKIISHQKLHIHTSWGP
jgi:hypothetical protein